MMPLPRHALDRNVRLYPAYQVLFNLYFWMPVFVLYFSEHLPLGRVLQLEAIYYATVVVLEVPSGYFSDSVGRRLTLTISAVALVAAYALFFLGGSFAVFAAAQMLLAAGISFNSGTDTSLHYDSLDALGRGGEYADREAAVHRWALVGRAAAAVAGGAAAMLQLRMAYGLSLLAALGVLGVALAMAEPPRGDDGSPRRGFARQVLACLRALANRALAWLFAFAVLMIVINHVPYFFYQPYIDLLIADRGLDLPGRDTPLATGAITAATMLVASWATARSIRLRDRIGLAPTLLGTTALQVAIMAAMALVLHEAVLLLILLRSVPAALMQPPMRAAIQPQLPQSIRATYLSMQSLVGRSAFALTLLGLSAVSEPGAAASWEQISLMSGLAAAAGAAGLVALAAAARPCLGSR